MRGKVLTVFPLRADMCVFFLSYVKDKKGEMRQIVMRVGERPQRGVYVISVLLIHVPTLTLHMVSQATPH